MKILFFCTTWGQKTSGWDDFLKMISESGYHGVETGIVPDQEKQQFLESLGKYKLSFIGQHWETNDVDFNLHRDLYEKRLYALAALNPLFINSHTGKDYFSFEQNHALIELAKQVEVKTGIQIIHETHRSRFAFAAHITRDYLEKIPDLNLAFDVSHWCNVAESLLQDQQEAVNAAMKRASHIHARIGFEQGPQVSDPSQPQYKEALQFHLNCWDEIISYQKELQKEYFTITPEFGPAPYMPCQQSPSRQWKYNIDMMNMLKKRYLPQ